MEWNELMEKYRGLIVSLKHEATLVPRDLSAQTRIFGHAVILHEKKDRLLRWRKKEEVRLILDIHGLVMEVQKGKQLCPEIVLVNHPDEEEDSTWGDVAEVMVTRTAWDVQTRLWDMSSSMDRGEDFLEAILEKSYATFLKKIKYAFRDVYNTASEDQKRHWLLMRNRSIAFEQLQEVVAICQRSRQTVGASKVIGEIRTAIEGTLPFLDPRRSFNANANREIRFPS